MGANLLAVNSAVCVLGAQRFLIQSEMFVWTEIVFIFVLKHHFTAKT